MSKLNTPYVTWCWPLKEGRSALKNDREEMARLTVTRGFLLNAEDLKEGKLHDSCFTGLSAAQEKCWGPKSKLRPHLEKCRIQIGVQLKKM